MDSQDKLQHFDISMTFLSQGDRLYLQLRNGKNQLGVLGLIGAFGGKIENEETPDEAAVRELREETNIDLKPEDLKALGSVDVLSEVEGVPVTITSNIFVTEIPDGIEVEAKEGTLVEMSRDEARARLAELTPATKAAMEQLF